jgi:hypothetical protein
MISPDIPWIDRDSAARHLFQLVRHFPQSDVSQHALDILAAIRSPVMGADLLQVVFDSARRYWERAYALRAYAALPGDLFTPLLAELFRQELYNWLDAFEDTGRLYPEPRDSRFIDIIGVVKNHPSNVPWLQGFFNALSPQQFRTVVDVAAPYYSLYRLIPLLFGQLRILIERDPTLLSLDIADLYYFYGSEQDKQWLSGYLPRLVEGCLMADETPILMRFWPALANAVVQRDSSREIQPILPLIETAEVDYFSSPMGQHYAHLYKAALIESQSAMEKLIGRATDPALPIALRALATHFIGKLPFSALTIETLCVLLHTDQGYWQDYKPIVRFEAGEALCYSASPIAWTTMVITMLERPDNELFLTDWLEHLTDTLMGISTTYNGLRYGESAKPWFKELWDFQGE